MLQIGLAAQWGEARSSHQQLKAGIAKKLPWTEDMRVSSTYPCGLLKVQQEVTVAIGAASRLNTHMSRSLRAIHPAAPVLPELTWQLADCKENDLAGMPEQCSAGPLKFRASILYEDQPLQASSSTADAGPLPTFESTGTTWFEWSPDCSTQSASFNLPEEGRRLSNKPCGLQDPHALRLQISISSGFAGIQPLSFSFPYSDDPASVGDFSQHLDTSQRLKAQYQELLQVR